MPSIAPPCLVAGSCGPRHVPAVERTFGADHAQRTDPYSGPRSPVFGTEPQRHRVAAGFRSKGDTRSRRRAYAVHTVSRGENAK